MSKPDDNILPLLIEGDGSSAQPAPVDIVSDAFRIALDHWKTIAAWIVGFTAVAAAISLMTPPTYVVGAEVLMLNKRLAEPGAVETSRSAYVRYESPNSEDLQTEIRILETDALLDGAANRLSKMGSLRTISPAGSDEIPVPCDDELDELADGLSFSVVPGTHVILAELQTGDPDLGARFLDAFMAEYLVQRPNILSDNGAIEAHRQNRDFYKARLDALENRLKLLHKESLVGDFEQEKAISLQHIEQELTAVSALQDRILEVEQLLSYLEGAVQKFRDGELDVPPSTPARMADDELRDANARLFSALNDLQIKRATYTARSEAVRAARAAYTRQRSSYFMLIDRKIDELKSEQFALTAAVADKQDRIDTLSTHSTELQDRLAARETIAIEQTAAQEAFLAASARLNAAEARQTSEYSGFSNVRLLQAPQRPESPSSPNLKLNLILGFMTGGIFAAVHVMTRELSSPFIRSELDAKNLLGLPIIDSYAKMDRA
jgi:uncharacterized protein involved in exopolysaccharide biosynthesis